jgi:hypothetical protein
LVPRVDSVARFTDKELLRSKDPFTPLRNPESFPLFEEP